MEDYEEDDDYDEYDDEEESEGMILSIGEDGKANLSKTSDWVQVEKKEMDLIAEFLKLKSDEFQAFLKNKKGEDQ